MSNDLTDLNACRVWSGSSCEQCAPGYRRVGSLLLGGACVPCECNGHSNECDFVTGECYNCQDYTMGAHCEICVHGFNGG